MPGEAHENGAPHPIGSELRDQPSGVADPVQLLEEGRVRYQVSYQGQAVSVPAEKFDADSLERELDRVMEEP